MTDRVRTLTVTLDRDYRTDDVLPIMDALKMIIGVAVVEFDDGDVVSPDRHCARHEFKRRLGRAISELAAGSDEEFLKSCLDSHAALVARRGY